jgi:tetratricopeptide (TPR) repeat protein
VRRKLLLRAGIPAAVVIAVAAYFIIEPILVKPVPLSERPKIAVLAFENQTGDSTYDYLREGIPTILITSLEQQAQYLRVTTRERLRDLAKQLGQAQAAEISEEVGFEACLMDSVVAIVKGSFSKMGDQFVINATIMDPRTKVSKGSASARGEGAKSIPTMVDEMSKQISNLMGVSAVKVRKASRSVADVTTKSPEALKYFVEGKEHSDRFEFGEARACFDKAIALDSTFAIAYYYYARNVQGEFQPRGTREKYFALAMKHIDHAGWKERRYILAAVAGRRGDKGQAIKDLTSIIERYPDEKHAYFALAQCQESIPKAIPYCERALEIDPSFKNVYNTLAYWYREMGDLEKALAAVNKYIALAPNEWNPHDTKGDIYLLMNMPEQALEAYKQKDRALGNASDSYDAAEIWLLQGRVVEAEQAFRKMAAEPGGGGADGRTYMAMTRMFEGRFKEALSMLEDGIVLDNRDSIGAVLVHEEKFLLKAVICLELGDRAAAARELRRFNLEAWNDSWVRDIYFYIIGQLGREPAAREAYRAWIDTLDTPKRRARGPYWWAQGMIALSEGNSRQAVESFKKNIELKGMNFFLDHYMLAQAYIQSGEPGEAIGELEKSLEFRESPLGGRLAFAHLSAKVWYQLGTTYEAAGIKSKAIENYRKFLDAWKNADADRPEVPDAKRRLNHLLDKA